MNPRVKTLSDLRKNTMASTTPTTISDVPTKAAQSLSCLSDQAMTFPLQPVDVLTDDEEAPKKTSGTVVLSNNMCFSGGYGDVWMGRWEDGLKRSSVRVAVKVARPRNDKQDMSKINRRLKREMIVWKRLKHDNVAPLLGSIENFTPYNSVGMVSPWMQNGNLNCYQRTKHLNVQSRLQILCDVAAGLSYLHDENIIHGDLTGTNVLIDESGRACLIGFGISSIKAESEGASYWSSTIGCGMRYRAPELLPPIEGDLCDFQPVVTRECDVYAMGSIILQTLSGNVPYKEIRSDVYVLLTIAHGIRPRRPRCLVLTDTYWVYINLCWETSPIARPLAVDVLKTLKESLGPCKDVWDNDLESLES